MADLPAVGVRAVIENLSSFSSDSKKVTQGFTDMDTAAGGLGKTASGITGHLTSVAGGILKIGAAVAGGVAVGVIGLTAALSTFAVGGIKQAIDLDQQVANIAATMGATKETAGTLKEELKGLALDLSLDPNLTVNVTQAGQAIEVLAANGALAVDEFGRLTQSSKDLTVQTVALANATGSDFATAATIATDASNIFGLEADEMGKAVDGAAGIMNASKFDANDYAMALANAGPVTAEMGVSLEDFNTVIAGTASNFSSGSDAGTSFKTLMQRLANPTDEVKTLMDDLGISLFDSEGEFRGVEVVTGQLNTAFDDLTDAQKAQYAATLGGADGSRILLGLAEMTSEEFDALSESVNRSGQGLQAAALRVDTVKGAMDIFRGVIEAIQIQVGDQFLPLLKGMAVGFTELANQAGPVIVGFFGNVASSLEKVIGAFERFGVRGAAVSILGQLGFSQETIGQVTPIVDAITQGIDKITGAFDRFGARGAAVSIMGMLGLDPTTVGTLFTTIDTIIAKISIVSQMFQQFGAQGAAISFLSVIGLSPETIGTITVVIDTIIQQFTTFVNFWVTSWPVIQAVAMTAWVVIQGIFNGIVTALAPAIAQLTASFGQVGVALAALGINWTTVWNAIVTATGFVAAAIGAAIVLIIGLVAGLAAGLATGISTAISVFMTLSANIKTIIEGWAMAFTGFINMIQALFAGEWAQAWEGFKLIAQGSITVLTGIFQTMGTLIAGSLNVILSTIAGFAEGVAGYFQGLYDTLIGSSIIPDLVNGIVKWFKELPQKIVSALSNLASRVTKPFKDMVAEVKDAVDVDEIIQLGENIMGGLWAGLKAKAPEVLEWLKSLIPDWIQSLADLAGAHSPATITMPLGASLVQGLVAGAQDEDFAAQFVDSLNMGTIARELGGGGSGWKEMRRIIGAAIEQNMHLLAEGNTQAMMAVIGDTAARFGFPPSVAQSFVQAHGLLDGLSEKYQAFMRMMRIEGLATATQLANSFSGIASSFAGMVAEQLGSMEDTQKKLADINKESVALATTIKKQEEKWVTLQDRLKEAVEKYGDGSDQVLKLREELALLTSELDANRAAQAGLARKSEMDIARLFGTGTLFDKIAILENFLASDKDLLRVDDAGYTDLMWNRVIAQRELNELKEQQIAQEQELLRQQEAQRKLDFLGQQVQLLKLIQDQGLDPADVIGGITLGLNASVEDLLAATNNVIEAMIDQINATLQIASPSALMAEVGTNIMAGLQQGILAMGPTFATTLQASIAAPIASVAAPVAAPAALGNIYNFYTGGNNIHNGMDEAAFEARVLGVLMKNL